MGVVYKILVFSKCGTKHLDCEQFQMAKKAPEVNRSSAVRDYLAKHPEATGPEVAAALKREGVNISLSLVAKVRARDAKGGGRSKRSVARTSTNGSAANTSKADSIRQVAQGMPKPIRPRDVVAALNEQGISVSPAQVSQVLKSMGLKRRRRGRKPSAMAGRATTTTSESLSLESLLAAKKLVNQLGSIETAKAAVDALVKLS